MSRDNDLATNTSKLFHVMYSLPYSTKYHQFWQHQIRTGVHEALVGTTANAQGYGSSIHLFCRLYLEHMLFIVELSVVSLVKDLSANLSWNL